MPLLTLQRDVFVRRGEGMTSNQGETRFADLGADTMNGGALPQMHVDCALVHEFLDLAKSRFALFGIELGRLLLKERVNLWIGTIDVRATLCDECLKTRGGVAEGAAGPLDDILEPFLSVPLKESSPLERSELCADAHCLEIVDHSLGEIGERAVTEIVASIKALRIPCSNQ